MHKFILFIKEFRIYKRKELLDALASFSKKQFSVFLSISIIAIISTIILVGKINNMFLVQIPVSGGTITEGIVGVPTLINPVIALSDADKDLTTLVYSGLMRQDSSGEFIPDLAESFEVSPDGTIYTFKIKENIRFHDGEKVTADDVIFTIEKIKDPTIKSPRKLSWDGISASKTDDYTVVFTLAQPYISFLDNTTIGILPLHIWKNINVKDFNISPFNKKAIGSGPYKIKSVIKNNDGLPEKYKLVRFSNFALGKPLIKNINIISYANEKDLVKALSSHDIDQAGGISPENITDFKNGKYNIHEATLPRMFGIFFNNANNKLFSNQSIVRAFDVALDRQEIVNEVLGGYGSIIHNPVPVEYIEEKYEDNYINSKLDEANNILEKDGWIMGEDGIRTKGGETSKTVTKNGKKVTEKIKNPTPLVRLSFSLITGDTIELKEATTLIKDQLAKVGIEVNIKIYETGQLNQLIRARDYEALFFGQFINHESSLYSFWHSSQKTDPGLNIAMYSNKKVDSILEFIQKILKKEDRADKYADLAKEFENSIPALLIYSPKYLYTTSPNLNNIIFNGISIPSDRFNSVYEWSANTDKVWKVFTK